MSAVSPRPRLGDALGQLRELGPRVVLARWGVALAAVAVALAVTIRTHLYFMRPFAMPVMNDEGTFAGIALRMMRGHWLPYVDGVSQDGPIPYWLAAVAMHLGGAFSWTPLRILALGLALAIEASVFLLGLELFSPFAAGVAVLVQTYFFTFQVYPLDTIVHDGPLGNNSALAYGSELVGVQFALLSALLIARVQTRPAERRTTTASAAPSRALTIAVAGALAACAGLSKEGMLVHVAPALLWLVVGPIGSRGRGATWVDLASYFLGLAVPFAVVLVIYGSAGHVRQLVYYYHRYGRDIFMAPLTSELVREKLREQIDKYLLGIIGVSFLALFGLARTTRALLRAPRDAGSWRARVRASAPSLFALLHLAAALVGASFTWRFFPQYFVGVYPFLGLVAGHALCESLEGMDEHQLPKVFAGIVVVSGATVLLAITTHTLHEDIVIGRQSGQSYLAPQADPIVRYLAETTKASDAVFVWGRHAELYVSARRQPASRFVDTVYPAGVVPWFPASTAAEQELRVVPGSRELLLADLEESKPELIVDDGRTLDGRYMYSFPLLRDYLDREYCFVRHVDGEPIYRRRHGNECSPPDTVQ